MLPAPAAIPPFIVGHIPLKLRGDDAEQLLAMRELWERLFVPGTKLATSEDVTVWLSELPLTLETGEEVYAAKALQVLKTAAGFFLRCGASGFEVMPGEAGRLYLAADFWRATLFEQREFFLLGLLMLLRPSGLYGLHACGLRRGETGALLVGPSGAGKTTTALSLIRYGWAYVSDDVVLLRAALGGAEALAFRKGFSCTPKTLAAFGNLRGDDEFGDPAGKRVVNPDEAYGGGFIPCCTPRLLLFPSLGAAHTELRPLPSALALVRLSQQSAGIMTDRAVSRAQLELLKRLVGQARCFELSLGEDALHDPALVNRILGELD